MRFSVPSHFQLLEAIENGGAPIGRGYSETIRVSSTLFLAFDWEQFQNLFQDLAVRVQSFSWFFAVRLRCFFEVLLEFTGRFLVFFTL
jgi:hypothetical protein